MTFFARPPKYNRNILSFESFPFILWFSCPQLIFLLLLLLDIPLHSKSCPFLFVDRESVEWCINSLIYILGYRYLGIYQLIVLRVLVISPPQHPHTILLALLLDRPNPFGRHQTAPLRA